MNGVKRQRRIYYSDLFWLFMAGNLIGVLLEGTYCYFAFGHWETHTVAVWGPFCLLYGIAAVLLYTLAILLENRNIIIQFLIYTVAASLIEYLSGLVLLDKLGMRAWDYDGDLFNIDGLVCPLFSMGWGLLGIVFAKFLVPPLEKLLAKMRGGLWRIACIALSIFMAIDLSVTAACIIRWSERHEDIAAHNEIESYIDKTWNDNVMQKRFVEWYFVDKDA